MNLREKLFRLIKHNWKSIKLKQNTVTYLSQVGGRWCCGLSLAYHFIIEPVVQYILIVNGINFETPEFDFSQLSTIVMAMLGMSGLRTYEKTKK